MHFANHNIEITDPAFPLPFLALPLARFRLP